MKRDQRLKTKRTHREATRQDQRLEIVKIAADLSIGLREPGNGTLWKCRPPLKRKREHLSGASGSGRDQQRRRPLFGERVAGERLKKMKKMRDNWCRLLGTNSLKEGAV
jgi:hypothetical protein